MNNSIKNQLSKEAKDAINKLYQDTKHETNKNEQADDLESLKTHKKSP